MHPLTYCQSFAPPTLHLLIVDDDTENWAPRLERSLEAYLGQWGLYSLGFFHYEAHFCESKASFLDTAKQLLSAGEIVYAAVDLILPRRDGEIPDRKLWKDMIHWCLKQRGMALHRGAAFDFCVMSADDTTLNELYSDNEHGRDLRGASIKRVSKAEVEDAPVPEGHLAVLWDDVRNFIRSHITCCLISETGTRSSFSTPIWFGDDPKLSELRYQADRISRQRDGGLYLIFSDATGYEEDWFRLVSRLRGTQPAQTKIFSFADIHPHRDPDWERVFREPPEMFLVSRIDRAIERGCQLDQVIQETNFFERIKESQGSVVFIQFPYASGEQDVRLTLDPEEKAVLELCLAQVGAPPSRDLETGFAYSKNPRIIHFPSNIELKAAGVIEKNVEFEQQQCRRQGGKVDRPLNPRIAAVLSEIPWHERNERLFALRESIRHAYRKAEITPESCLRYVGEDLFSDEVARDLSSTLGFTLSGRWLFERLSRSRTFSPEQNPASEMLRGLEEVYDLYEGLDRLVELRNQLVDRREDTVSVDFSKEHFNALKEAHEFLDLVFDNKEYLMTRIRQFKRVVENPNFQRSFRDFYPSLRERPNWQELVEQMRFVWPYDTFPLPNSVSRYLLHSNVVAEFHPNFQDILLRYEVLGERWKKNTEERRRLKELLQERESQRWAAECYVRDVDSLPVCVPLAEDIGKWNDASEAFDTSLRSFLIFNAHMAVCENLFSFGASILKPSEVRGCIERPDLGTEIILLTKYVKRLQREGRLKASVLSGWCDSWPALGSQKDAVRIAVRLSQWLMKNGSLREEDPDSLVRLSKIEFDHDTCRIEDILDMFRIIRNNHIKVPMKKIWAEQGERIWDLLRRVAAATTHPSLRLGWKRGDGGEVAFWSRGVVIPRDAEILDGTSHRFLNIFLDSEIPLFPVDDLVRVNPQDGSVWGAYSNGGDWYQLTYMGAGESRRTPSIDQPWLPSKDDFLSSAVWRHANGED